MNVKIRSVLILIAALLGVVVTASLGRWQLSRAAEKESLQAAISSKAQMPVLQNQSLEQVVRPESLVHQRAVLVGQWRAESTVYLDNRQLNGKVGFFVLTPFQLENSALLVWVQRGWVPRNFIKREQVPTIETVQGKVQIVGRIAPPPSKLYDPGSADSGFIRQNLNIDSLQLQGNEKVCPVILQQLGEPSEGMLRDWPNIHVGVDKHYGYAAQWFGLCTLIAILFVWFQIAQPLFKRYKKVSQHVQ